jgi:hypothetical protein
MNAVTYHHAESGVQNKIGQGTTNHRTPGVMLSPLEPGNRDHERLHESDRERVRIHEHGSGHGERALRTLEAEGCAQNVRRNHGDTGRDHEEEGDNP